MKKLLLLISLFTGLCISAAAQDIIRTKDGRTIEARIIEVGTSNISYKRYSNPNGPTFTLALSQIKSIEYQNGDSDVFGRSNNTVRANTYENKKYKELKRIYNPRRYNSMPGDPNSVFGAGLASFFIPGLGQVIDGEVGRGLAIWAGSAAITVGTYVSLINYTVKYSAWLNSQGYTLDDQYINTDSLDYSTFPMPGGFLLWVAAGVIYQIWNITDACKIAKVKNMYWQDCMGYSSVSLSMDPYFAFTPTTGTGLQPVTGLSLKLTF